jgi:hypothetical protein
MLRVFASRLARTLAVAAPPLLLASALFAAPKGKTVKPAKPPSSKSKDGGLDGGGGDAAPKPSASVGKELKPDAAPLSNEGAKGEGKGEGGELLKESEKKDGDAAVKVFEFGTTEIEARARWPAVTYFVRRMRAEFEAQKLPHRPFLPELEATKGDPAVK